MTSKHALMIVPVLALGLIGSSAHAKSPWDDIYKDGEAQYSINKAVDQAMKSCENTRWLDKEDKPCDRDAIRAEIVAEREQAELQGFLDESPELQAMRELTKDEIIFNVIRMAKEAKEWYEKALKIQGVLETLMGVADPIMGKLGWKLDGTPYSDITGQDKLELLVRGLQDLPDMYQSQKNNRRKAEDKAKAAESKVSQLERDLYRARNHNAFREQSMYQDGYDAGQRTCY